MGFLAWPGNPGFEMLNIDGFSSLSGKPRIRLSGVGGLTKGESVDNELGTESGASSHP